MDKLSPVPDQVDSNVVLVWTTMPEASAAATLAETLVREQLAACVHVLPQGSSFYYWEGRIQQDSEWTLLIKTRQTLYPSLEARLLEQHPYDTPEILVTPVTQGLPAYMAWLLTVTQAPPSS